jgi:hypothetical protein
MMPLSLPEMMDGVMTGKKGDLIPNSADESLLGLVPT